MSELETTLPATCGRCAYYKRVEGSVRGACRYYRRPAYSSMTCLAAGKAEADLPHCQACGKAIEPARTAKSGSKYCVECWEAELRRQEDKRLRFGLDLAAGANGGTPAKCVAWCSWGLFRRQQQETQGHTGVMVGAAVGGLVGALVGAAIDGASAGPPVVTYTGTIGLAAVTDWELLLLPLSYSDFGTSPALTAFQIRDFSQRDASKTKVAVEHLLLSAIRARSDGASVEFEFEGKKRQFSVANVPEIPHQPTADAMVRSMRERGALPPVPEFAHAVLSGAPAFNAPFWQRVVSNGSYWHDLTSWLASAKLTQDAVMSFFSTYAASIPELQTDDRYVELLWLLFAKLPPEFQQELAHDWLKARPGFLDAFAEKLHLRCQQQSLTQALATRSLKRVESILKGGE